VGQRSRLKIKNVSVGSTDDKSPLSYQSRTVKIEVHAGTITTPQRAATFSEIIQKRNVPIDVPIKNVFGFNLKRLNYIDTRAFLNKSSAFELLYENLARNSRTLAHSPIQICLIQPTLSPLRKKEYVKKKNGKLELKIKRKPSALSILSKETIRQKFLRQLIAMQDLLGLDPIAIPYLALPLTDYRKAIDQVNRALEPKDKEPIFFLDMNDPNFTALLRYLTSAKGSRIVGLYYRKFQKAVQEYETLYNYRKKDVAFMMVETDRFDPALSDVSAMHMMPFLGNDIMAVEFPRPSIIDEHDPVQVEKQRLKQSMPVDNRIRGFNSEELSLKEIGFLLNKKNELLYEVGKPNDPSLKLMLDNYNEATNNSDNFKALNSFFKVHEIAASSKEFEQMQRYISDGSGQDYVEKKTALGAAIGRLRDGTLDKFRTQ
jgi:hypothetical protein